MSNFYCCDVHIFRRTSKVSFCRSYYRRQRWAGGHLSTFQRKFLCLLRLLFFVVLITVVFLVSESPYSQIETRGKFSSTGSKRFAPSLILLFYYISYHNCTKVCHKELNIITKTFSTSDKIRNYRHLSACVECTMWKPRVWLLGWPTYD